MELAQNLVETKNNNLIKVEFPFLYTYYKHGISYDLQRTWSTYQTFVKEIRILFTVGNVDRDIGRYSGRYSGRQSVDTRSTLGQHYPQ